MSHLSMNVDPFSTPVREPPTDAKSGVVTKPQIIELINSIEFTGVPVPTEYVNSDHPMDLETFLTEMCLPLSRILVKNCPLKTSPKKLIKIGSFSDGSHTPTKIVPRVTDLEASIRLGTPDISDTHPIFPQRLKQMTEDHPVQQTSDGSANSGEMIMSSDYSDTSALH